MDLIHRIKKLSTAIVDPAGRTVRIIKERPSLELASQYDCNLSEIYIKALSEDIWPYRYIRNRNSYSAADQIKLAQSAVTIAGAGGLGGHTITLLARTGIGHLNIFDYDEFDETNLNRQVISNVSSLGEKKVRVAQKTVKSINPAVSCSISAKKISQKELEKTISGTAAVVDALDNISDRFIIERSAKKMNIPLVHGAIAGFEGQVMTIYPEDKGLKQIYGAEPPGTPSTESPEAIMGTPSPTPSLVATLQTMEVIKVILNREDILRNRLLHVNLETSHFHIFKL